MTKPGKKIKLKVRVNKIRKIKSIEERIIKDSEFIEDFDEKVEHCVDDYVDRVARTKQLTLISGVGFFMLLIVFFYAYNFKFQVTNLVKEDEENIGIDNQIDSIKESVENIVDNYKEVKDVIDKEIEDVKSLEDDNLITSEEVPYVQNTLPNLETEGEDQSIEELKKKLLENISE
jgi:hypothetical protein